MIMPILSASEHPDVCIQAKPNCNQICRFASTTHEKCTFSVRHEADVFNIIGTMKRKQAATY